MDIKKLSETIAKVLSESPEFLALFFPQTGAPQKAPSKRMTKEERKKYAKAMIMAAALKSNAKYATRINDKKE